MGVFDKLFGTRSQREIKKIQPTVDRILAMEDEYKALSEEALTDEEYNKLQELKEFTGMDGSRVIRRLLNLEKLKEKPSPETLKVLRELRYIKDNLDQISRVARKNNPECIETIAEIRKEYHYIKKALYDYCIN